MKNEQKNKRELSSLYKWYFEFQGDNPFDFGYKLTERLQIKHYKLKTMRPIVSLLQKFDKDFSDNRIYRNKYQLLFHFDTNRDPNNLYPLGVGFSATSNGGNSRIRLFIIDKDKNVLLKVYQYNVKDKTLTIEDDKIFKSDNNALLLNRVSLYNSNRKCH